MSYVEHGPRIFLAGDNKKRNKNSDSSEENQSRGISSRSHLVYGDYVIPRKRSEGRLKAYESCTDIRAWSQNSLDNSRYIRELAEHAKTPGKIVPLNVVVDNVIGLGAKTQNELNACRRELQKYKSLTLTTEQQHQIQSAGAPSSPRLHRSRSKPANSNSQKSEFGATVRAYSASPSRTQKPAVVDKSLQTESEAKPIVESRGTSARLLSKNRKKSSEENSSDTFDNKSPPVPPRPAATTTNIDTSNKKKDLRDLDSIGTTSEEYTAEDYENEENESEESGDDRASGNEEILDHAQWSTPDKRTGKGTESTSGRTGTETGSDSGSGSGSGSGTPSITDFETDDETNKAAIIHKDSEIIALKNELGAKEAEIEELRDFTKMLEKSLNEKDEGIQFLKGSLSKLSEHQLAGVGDEILHESEILKKKIGVCECAISELRGDLKEKVSMCRAQAREIEDLRFRVKEGELLRVEKDSLARKVNEMGELLLDAEKCARAFSEMKSALRERDELRCQNREQSCLLADQEDEIKRLLLLVKRLSAKYEGRQIKMRGAMESMRVEIEEKHSKICQCQVELSSMEKEVGCLNVKLKTSMNSMDEFKVAYQEACNCADLDRDIYSQAKNALCKLNLTMIELKEYKLERENLLGQIGDMKNQILNNNNKLDRFCCQHSPLNDNKNANGDRNLSEMSTLDIRKRKCMLHEDLEELDKELGNRMKGEKTDGMMVEDQLDVVASAKQTINRLNNAMLDLDVWECEKASMKDTIERLKIQISTLTGNEGGGGGENVERRIVDQASNSLAKLSQLLKELKQYQTERQLMREQIKNLTEALKDSQSAASCKGVTLLKQRLYDLRLENEKDRSVYAEELKSLQSRLEEAENTSSCAGVKTLRLKLREALRAAGTDSKIDEVLAIHVKKSIERVESISKEIKEVDEERTEIVKEIAKQQQEIEVRNVEIVRLRKQMNLESARRQGEGDRAEEGLQELAETKRQLIRKIEIIQDLEDRLQSLQFQMLGSNQEQTSLRQRVKIIENEKNKLTIENDNKTKELESKNEEIACLISKMNSAAKIMPDFRKLEEQIEEMKPRLITLQTTNERLTREVATLKGVLSERNEEIISLVDERAKHLEAVSINASSYESDLSKQQKEFDRVFRANKSLTIKLLEAEGKISELNGLITGFKDDRAKLDQISNLQREILRLTKDKRKLEGDLRGLRSQLVSFESSNKKLDDDLTRIFGENETLKHEIQILCEDNGRLSSELVGEVSAKEQLSKLPDKLNKDIAGLKLRLQNTEERAGNVLQELQNRVEELQAKCSDDENLINELQRMNKYQNDQASINEEKISVLEKSNSELKAELVNRSDELKELSLRLKKIESNKSEKSIAKESDSVNERKRLISLDDRIDDKTAKDGDEKPNESPRNISESDNLTVAEISCRLNNSENENKQRQTEIQKLHCDLKSKNNEINSLREGVEALTEERDTLNERIRNKEIQNSKRLQALKTTYEGCVKVMHEKHNESIARLQAQYEEAIKDSDYFDSESWLRSLSLKEIADLHSRICMAATSCSLDINERLNNTETSVSSASLQRRQEEFNEKHQLDRKIANLENEILQREQQTSQKVRELETTIDREKTRNAELNKALTMLSCENETNIKPNPETTNSISAATDTTENEKDILRRQSAYNQDRAENYGILLEQQRKIVKNLETELMDGSSKAQRSYDLRKKDFIHQCSTYNK